MEIKLISPEISHSDLHMFYPGKLTIEIWGILPAEYEDGVRNTCGEIIFGGHKFIATRFELSTNYEDNKIIRTITIQSHMSQDEFKVFKRRMKSDTIVLEDIENIPVPVVTEKEKLKFNNAIDCLELEI